MKEIEAKRKKFVNKINKNTDLLNMLSLDRLLKLEKYYENIIEKNEKIIEKMKKDV